jgi:hypothetical protein
MNIRLMGDGDQVAAAVALLETLAGLRITSVSRPYANRGDEQVRVYLDAEATTSDRTLTGGDLR